MVDNISSPGRKPETPAAEKLASAARSFGGMWRARAFSARDRRSFYLQIERGLHAGIPLLPHLQRLAGTAHGRRRDEIRRMISILEDGGQLYEAAYKASPLFPGAAPALLCAAERTGNVPATLASMAEGLKYDIEVARRVRNSLAYPSLLILSAAFLIPLPRVFSCGTTAYILGAASILLPFAAAALIIGGVRLAAMYPKIGKGLGMLADMLPVIGSVRRGKALAITLDTLGQAIGAGLGLFESLTIARTAAGNGDMTRMCDSALAAVKGGGNLSSSLGMERSIPDDIAVAISTGENTGNLPEALAEGAAQLRTKYASRVTLLVRILATAILAGVMMYAAFTIIGSFTRLLGIGGDGGFDMEIQKEIPGLFNQL